MGRIVKRTAPYNPAWSYHLKHGIDHILRLFHRSV